MTRAHSVLDTIYTVCDEDNTPRRKKPSQSKNAHLLPRVRALSEAGARPAQIARELGISRNSVAALLKRLPPPEYRRKVFARFVERDWASMPLTPCSVKSMTPEARHE